MRVVEVEQNTDEWDELRLCRITASRVGDVMAKPDTQRYQGYMRELALELLGHRNVEQSPEWFVHGREMEPRALMQYSLRYGAELNRNVMLIHDEHDWLSCSPDSLVVVDGEYVEGVEVKSRKLFKNYRDAIKRLRDWHEAGKNMARAPTPGDYVYQLQTAMMITGWDYWWYVNYYEDTEPKSPTFGQFRIGRARIPRDQKIIDEIECRCIQFMTDTYKMAQGEF